MGLGIGLALLILGVIAGWTSRSAAEAFENYKGYMAKAAALRWLRFRLFGIALGWWAVVLLGVALMWNGSGQ